MGKDMADLDGRLPLALPPEFACPICGAKVHLAGVTEWGLEDGEIVRVEYDCETEPDIDSDDWWDWHRGYFSMPYVDWLPWEVQMLRWLNRHYRYRGPT
jgi:hypothetical protein